MPTVSIIVPNYNHARYLRKRIDSVLEQTYRDFEVILMDDCSTDESRSIIGEYGNDSRVRIEFNERNSGSTFKQWNKGIQLARGRYIWLAESDDYADTGFLGKMVAILEEQTEITFAYCRSWSVGEDDQRLGFGDAYLNWLDAKHWTADFVVDGFEECRRYFVLGNPVPNASAVLFRKDVYERVGGANEGFRVCADYKVWADLALEGRIAYVGEPLNYFRTHGANVRTRSLASALDVGEYFYVMLSILERVAPAVRLTQESALDVIFGALPLQLDPRERIEASKKASAYVEEWNLRHNQAVPREVVRAFFKNLGYLLKFKEFAISPPGRWQFFTHKFSFYRHSFPEMSWKMRAVNLMRVLGASIIGYRHRHWPEQAYTRIIRKLDASGAGR